jgi:hypothetical protein
MGYVEIIPLDQCDQCDSCQAIKPKDELWVISAAGLDLMYECDRAFVVNKTITVNDEFNALAIAYARAAKMDNPMEGAIQKLNLAKSIARDAEAIGAEMVVARYLGIADFEPTSKHLQEFRRCGRGQYSKSRLNTRHGGTATLSLSLAIGIAI